MVLDGDDEQSRFVVIRIGELHGLADKFRTLARGVAADLEGAFH
jgi:hypothetical protein